MKTIRLLFLLITLLVVAISFANEHEEKHTGKDHKEEGHKEAEHAEENSKIGPDKGITAFDKEEGFKISKEAEGKFELKYMDYRGKGSLEIPKSAVFFGLEEKNLFRQRNGFFKRIDFNVVSKTGDNIKVESSDLKSGDRIVMTGIGFLRIVEITASGGLGEGHHHKLKKLFQELFL